MIIWNIKKEYESRLRQRHPWVFANELVKSPKEVPLGCPIELRTSMGEFLARGYGNPHSFIAFRALSFNESERNFWTSNFLLNRLINAYAFRCRHGFSESFRVCFSEADEVPGLIIDRYEILQQNRYQVFVVQVLTAGMEALLGDAQELLKEWVEFLFRENLSRYSWDKTIIVMRQDGKTRELEGLSLFAPKLLKSIDGVFLEEVDILLSRSYEHRSPHLMRSDLLGGQKTGFFLDQSANISLVSRLLKRCVWSKDRPIRILDLCCHLGQWSVQLGSLLKDSGYDVEVTAVDSSERCVQLAGFNIERAGVSGRLLKMDVLEGLSSLNEKFDVIVTDPPAFVKNRKDLVNGTRGYMKLNAQALSLLAPGGVYVTCSCSGLLSFNEFKNLLTKTQNRVQKNLRCLSIGGHAVDHPIRGQFPEGEYLKMLVFADYENIKASDVSLGT